MGTQFETTVQDFSIADDALLDQLIPRSTPSIGRTVVSTMIVAGAAAIAALSSSGYVYPQPQFGHSMSSDPYGLMMADPSSGLAAVEFQLVNDSGRDIRVTSVTFDHAEVELIDATILLAPPSTSDMAIRTEGPMTELTYQRLAEGDALPAFMPAGQRGSIAIFFQPKNCQAPTSGWGAATIIIDFGAGAFPPFRREISLYDGYPASDEVSAATDGSASSVDLDPQPRVAVLADGTLYQGDNPLGVVCQALGR